MKQITLIATTAFGLESVVKREVEKLGFSDIVVSDGKVAFLATIKDIPTANLWLRSADRVLLKIGEFEALTFDDLFDSVKALPWEQWIPKEGKFTVTGKSVRSQLGSIRACQSIVKKAVVEKLKEKYQIDWFDENGPSFTIQVSLLKDIATLTIDTTGVGLHKRGYRKQGGEAPLKETLAAALVQLSTWRGDTTLIDPMCGSGTILIEAAMIAKNIAPGLNRSFVSEEWSMIPKSVWVQARKSAQKAIKQDVKLNLLGYDIDAECIQISRANAHHAGVHIVFLQKDIKDLWIDTPSGVAISNPPYGERLSDFQTLNEIYISIHKTFRKKLGWAVFILTADKKFPDYFKRATPDRVRKLYNGRIQVGYYQYRSKT